MVQAVPGVGHLGQGIALTAQPFRQSLHGGQHGVGGHRPPHRHAGQHGRKGRRRQRLPLQAPEARLAAAVFEGLRHLGRGIVTHVGPAQTVTRTRLQQQGHAYRRDGLIQAERGLAVIVTLRMQQFQRAFRIGAGPAFQGQQAVRRFFGKLGELAGVLHLALQPILVGRFVTDFNAQGIGYGRALPGRIRFAACFRLLGVRRLRTGVAALGQQTTAAQPRQHEQGRQQKSPRRRRGQREEERAEGAPDATPPADGMEKAEKREHGRTHSVSYIPPSVSGRKPDAGGGIRHRPQKMFVRIRALGAGIFTGPEGSPERGLSPAQHPGEAQRSGLAKPLRFARLGHYALA